MTRLAYSDAVKSRCREPHRAGTWPASTPHVGTGAGGSLEAGALARVQVRLSADGAVVEDARFTAFGCSAVVASASYVADRLVGAPTTVARAVDPSDVVDALGLPENKRAMARLATDAARAAVEDWEQRTEARGSGTGAEHAAPVGVGSKGSDRAAGPADTGGDR